MSKKVLTLCLICREGAILLGMKKRGFGMGKWNGFGGKVNEGETIEDATKRELLEESGLTATTLEKVGILRFNWQGKEEDILEVHSFKALDFSGEPMETEEMKPQWFSIKDIPFEKMWPDDKYWVPLFLEGKKFEGKFLYDNENNVVEYDLKEVI
ncbi:MAG: 8-oxo-dGTP diphosphatase [Candidatus Staskawiczbacteria bacterium]|nr:8-oxo-dGTP diphosphatase [Candidatus Staskawiczbacteria bacterium]